MAIRLLPFRQYAEEDVVNLYSMDAANDQVDTAQGDGDAGIFVKVSAGDFSLDPIQYADNSYLGRTDYPFIGRDQYPSVPLKISAATSGSAVLGVTLLQTALKDENGEKLLYYPQKKLETQSVLTGEAVPVLGKGIVTLANGEGSTLPRAIDGTVNVGDFLFIRNAGYVTGVSSLADVPADCPCVGQIIGTGVRENRGVAPDQFAGNSIGTGAANASGLYAVARINCDA
tara:strand:- start:3134 stop:3820 length:687 start_codon:yes stop_codon:yes gene_type:complete